MFRFTLILLLLSCCLKGFSQNDSTKLKFLHNADIAAGYEYGLLPFIAGATPPNGNFKTQGSFGADILKVPLKATFHYSFLGTISGLNNHFTVRFDAQRYKKLLNKRAELEKLGKFEMLDSINLQTQKLKQKLNYMDLLKAGRIAFPVDSSLYKIFDFKIDSITFDTINIPQYDIPNFEWNDSLENQLTDYKESLSGLLEKRDSIEFYKLKREELLKSPDIPYSDKLTKVQEIASKIKQFEVGLCYPNYSEFLVSKIPIRGVNMELQHKKLFFAFTHGKTVNNIFLTNNLVQNNLNGARNLYNFFSFRNIEDGRRVTAGMIGYGAKSENHLHLGLLYGLGKVSYQEQSSLLSEKEHNLAAELSGLWKIANHSKVLINYGRSSVQFHNNQFETQTLLQELIDFKIRSNAALLKYELNLEKTGTSLETYARVVDPFYRSFGVGFLRSDNLRYQLKVKQKVSKNVKLGAFVRREQDNLLALFDFSNTITTYGADITIRPTKSWLFKADFRPIKLATNASVDTLSLTTSNWIFTGIANYNKRLKENYFSWNTIYSHYQISSSEIENSYINVTSNFNWMKKAFTEAFTISYFKTSDTLSLPEVILLENTISWSAKKNTIKGKLKAAFQPSGEIQLGYGLASSVKLYKGLSIEVQGERLVQGDFYNSLLGDSFNDFPFYFSGMLRWRFN